MPHRLPKKGTGHLGRTRARMEPVPDLPAGPRGDLARRLREARVEQGHSQAAVALLMEELGHSWHQTTVAKTERAERDPRYSELVALAEIFGLPLSSLMPDHGGRHERLDALARLQALRQQEQLLRLELALVRSEERRLDARRQELERRLMDVVAQAATAEAAVKEGSVT